MRTEKKIKKYADSKMEQFRDDEFLNSVCDKHFSEPSKPKYNRRAVVSVVASFVILLAIALSVSLTVQYTEQHYTAQYIITPSSVQELNDTCKYFSFAEREPCSVSLTTDRDSKEIVYYGVNYPLNSGDIEFTVVVNDNDNVGFNAYDKFMQYGDFNIYYMVAYDYDKNGNLLTCYIFANILTDCEKIKINYTGALVDDDAFFDILSTLLLIKE